MMMAEMRQDEGPPNLKEARDLHCEFLATVVVYPGVDSAHWALGESRTMFDAPLKA